MLKGAKETLLNPLVCFHKSLAALLLGRLFFETGRKLSQVWIFHPPSLGTIGMVLGRVGRGDPPSLETGKRLMLLL